MEQKDAHLQDLIRQVQVRFSAFYGLHLAKAGVSFSQFSALAALGGAAPLKMRELAGALQVSMPAATHLVDQLERKGLVRRRPHPRDRRVTLVQVTARGARTAARSQGRAARLLAGILSGFPAGERRTVERFMKTMRDGLDAAIAEARGQTQRGGRGRTQRGELWT